MKKEKLYQKLQYLQSERLKLHIIVSKILEIGYEEFGIPYQLMEDITSVNDEIYDNIIYIERLLSCLYEITEFEDLISECINTLAVIFVILKLKGIVIENFWFLKGDLYLLFVLGKFFKTLLTKIKNNLKCI